MKRYTRAARYTLISQVGLYGFLLLCLALKPNFLLQKDEGGISNYGVYTLTIVPYTLAFLTGGIYLYRAARALPAHISYRAVLSQVLTVLCFLLLFVLLTTYLYQEGGAFDELHIVIAVTLFVAELAIGVWLGIFVSRNAFNYALLGVEVVGFVLSALTFAGKLEVLSKAQIITGVGFGWLLVRSIQSVTSHPRKINDKIEANPVH